MAGKFNSQFMKIVLQQDEFIAQLNTILMPEAQFKDLEPSMPSLFFIAHWINFSEDPVEMMDMLMTHLTEGVLPQCMQDKKYKIFTNCMELLHSVTVSISSIRATERLFNDRKLYDFILALNKSSDKQSFLGGLFKSKDAKKDAQEASLRLLTLWTDVTMVY